MAEFPECFGNFGFGGAWGTTQFGGCSNDVVWRDTPGGGILSRNQDPAVTGNPNRFLELYGNELIPVEFYEPDASTFRSEYYYNTRENILYKKIPTSTVPHWKAVARPSGLS